MSEGQTKGTTIFHPVLGRTVQAVNFKVMENKSSDGHAGNGGMVDKPYIEFTVLGNNSNYRDLMLLKDFKQVNPSIDTSQF